MQRLLASLTVIFLGCLATPANFYAEDAVEFFSHRSRSSWDYGDAYYNTVALHPHEATAHIIVGNTWEKRGEYDNAITEYTEALRVDRSYAVAYFSRGLAWGKKGEYGKAVADYNQGLLFKPNDTYACNKLAWLYATCPDEEYRDGNKAIEIAKKACQFDGGKYWLNIGTLAAAYAETGDFEMAKQWHAKPIELAATDKSLKDKYRQDLRDRLELYKQGKPYREDLKKRQ